VSVAVEAPQAERDAYATKREERPGCQHQLGCRCDTPYHLRPSTRPEQQREAAYRDMFRLRGAP